VLLQKTIVTIMGDLEVVDSELKGKHLLGFLISETTGDISIGNCDTC
jgi:hypothetical protein